MPSSQEAWNTRPTTLATLSSVFGRSVSWSRRLSTRPCKLVGSARSGELVGVDRFQRLVADIVHQFFQVERVAVRLLRDTLGQDFAWPPSLRPFRQPLQQFVLRQRGQVFLCQRRQRRSPSDTGRRYDPRFALRSRLEIAERQND